MIFAPYGEMLQNYYAAKFEALRAERARRLAAVDSEPAAREYAAWARDTFRAAVGPMPEKTPLNARTAPHSVKDGVVTESVIFESRPGYFVSGILCRPERAAGRLPAVIGLCGHSQNGKNALPYRTFCWNLAANGFLSLLIDPAGQGERLQYTRVPHTERFNNSCCNEHNQTGKMLGLFDEHFGSWRLWDAVRGVDYLLSRPDVDSTRLGVTGCSGGGTLTSYLWAFDDRLTMAAPHCYLTSFFRNFDNELPVDSEQVFRHLAAAGFEMADFLIARAPLPAILLAKDADFFDPRGTRESFEEASKIYALLGKPEALELHFAPGGHGYDPVSRAAMYRFFARHAQLPAPKPELEPCGEVLAAPTGNVNDLDGARPLPLLLAEMVDAHRPYPVRRAAEWREFLKKTQHVEPPAAVPDYKFLRPGSLPTGTGKKREFAIVGIKTEPGILAVLHTAVPQPIFWRCSAPPETTLFIADFDAETELAERTGSEDGSRFALDVRGSGKSMPRTSDRDNDRYALYAREYMYDAAGMTLDDPLWGGRCRDVLAALKLLRAWGAETLHLAGSGQGAMLALGAALAAPELCDTLTLDRLPPSLGDLVKRGFFYQPQSFAPRGMLNFGDLPEMLAALEVPCTVNDPGDDYATPARE